MLQVGLGDAARGTIQYQSIFAVGTMLFTMTLLLNVGAQIVVNRFREVYE
jgi:phosphate transport system permease protein